MFVECAPQNYFVKFHFAFLASVEASLSVLFEEPHFASMEGVGGTVERERSKWSGKPGALNDQKVPSRADVHTLT